MLSKALTLHVYESFDKNVPRWGAQHLLSPAVTFRMLFTD